MFPICLSAQPQLPLLLTPYTSPNFTSNLMLTLEYNGELSGVKLFGFIDSENEPFFFTFKVACGACHEEHPNEIAFNAYETKPLANSRGEANFAMKCKMCGKEGNVNVVDPPNKLGVFDTDKNDSKHPARLVTFDCRGVDLVEFVPKGEFYAIGDESNTRFTVEFEDGEWYDYDEKSSQEVSITGSEWIIKKTK